MGKNKNKKKQQPSDDTPDEPIDEKMEVAEAEDATMNSGESSETDVKMEVVVGPELPPGFDAEETKEDATNASTNNSETSENAQSEPEPEEKKESEKTVDEKAEEPAEPGMISSALNGAKALTSSMLSTLLGSGNAESTEK